MFQRLVLSILAINSLCSFVSCEFTFVNATSCEVNTESELDGCREALRSDELSAFCEDGLITGEELILHLSHMCNNFPMLLRCVYNVSEQCPSYNVLPLLTNIERTRGLCAGNVPVNWLRNALQTIDGINITCVVPHLGPIFQNCVKMLPPNVQRDINTEMEMTTSLFRCVRTQLPAATSLQTDCGVSVRQVLLVQLVISAGSLVLPSDEEVNKIRLGQRAYGALFEPLNL